MKVDSEQLRVRPMTKLTRRETRAKILGHELWLESDQEQGAQADFSNESLWIMDLHKTNLARSIFSHSRLRAVEFVDSVLTNATFDGAELINVDFHNAILDGVSFNGTLFRNVHIIESDFDRLKSKLTKEQVKGITLSYGRFMVKIFVT